MTQPIKDKAEGGGGGNFTCVFVIRGEKRGRYSQVSAFFLFPPSFCYRFPHRKRNFEFFVKDPGPLAHTDTPGQQKFNLHSFDFKTPSLHSLPLWVCFSFCRILTCCFAISLNGMHAPRSQCPIHQAVMVGNLNDEMLEKVKITSPVIY